MFQTKFGVEIEFTGITRKKAAEILANYFSFGRISETRVLDPQRRIWSIHYDGSIRAQKKVHGRLISGGNEHRCELVTPVLTYAEDMATLQDIIRRLRKAGGITNDSCGIHVHVDGASHTPRTIWNLVNLVASRNDLFYKAFRIKPERAQFCKKMDDYMVKTLNVKRPKTFDQLAEIWYAGYHQARSSHYHNSRYHFLNLHSFFSGPNHTVEFRGYNSELHAGKVRAYVLFSLAINRQALEQKYAVYKHVQDENERFAMRVYLVRIGFVGEEFKSCRDHLCSHLSGNPAWRYGSKYDVSYHRKKPKQQEQQPNNHTSSDSDDEPEEPPFS